MSGDAAAASGSGCSARGLGSRLVGTSPVAVGMKVTFFGPDAEGGGVGGRYRRGELFVAIGEIYVVDACPSLVDSFSGVDKSLTRPMLSKELIALGSVTSKASTSGSNRWVVSALLLRDDTRSGGSLQKEDDSKLGGREFTPRASR